MLLVRLPARLRRLKVAELLASLEPEKCGWLKEELSFDEVIDYKSEDVDKKLGSFARTKSIYFLIT